MKFSHNFSYSNANTGLMNNSYASSEDETHKYQRVDSTASYTSEDEPQPPERNYTSQQSEKDSISYYNPESFDEEQQTSYYAEAVKRSFSYTSDEADDAVSYKRQKLRYDLIMIFLRNDKSIYA